MEFIDLAAQQRLIRDEVETRIRDVLNHGQYIMGPEVRELEQRLAGYVGVPHAVACASGTDALLMALMAYGVGPGDALLTTPFTFIATAEVIRLVGATPVFVDIERDTLNIDPDQLEEAVRAVDAGDRRIYPIPAAAAAPGGHGARLVPKGVIPVDLFGLPADYERIQAVADRHGLLVIEDAAQSFGADYRGRKACSLGDIGCTSFFPAKPLGCYGDGGMCFTRDTALSDLLDSIRSHGKGQAKYDNVRIGINGRLDTLQAAVLLAKFAIFPGEVEKRQRVADRYTSLLGDHGAFGLQRIPTGSRSAWAQYSLLAQDGEHRGQVQARLKSAGIPTAVYYPLPLHLQGAFLSLGYAAGEFPVSEDCAARIFSLPMHPYLAEEDQERITQALKEP
jgi:dTDP-4-amino-4,6-dideoxygalactose transaminase